jgi:plasmid stabilization system protein ParE
MDCQVILSDFFIADLKEIVEYLKVRANEEVASRIGNELVDRALGLGRNPFIGQLVRQRPGARKILRYSYRIYYDVNETQQIVEVLRIWHGARDPKTLRLS